MGSCPSAKRPQSEHTNNYATKIEIAIASLTIINKAGLQNDIHTYAKNEEPTTPCEV